MFDDCEITKKRLEDEILLPYRETLWKDMNDVKLCCKEKQGGVPNVVALTGSASRMPWLRQLVKDVFKDSEVHCDNEPSFGVSCGLVYYGLEVQYVKPAMESLKTSIATAFHKFNKQTLAPMLIDYVLSKMQDFLEDERMMDYAKEEPKEQKEKIRLAKFCESLIDKIFSSLYVNRK